MLGPRKEIIPHLACLLARHRRYLRRHISRYAPTDVSGCRTNIRRHSVELFLSATLIEHRLVITATFVVTEQGDNVDSVDHRHQKQPLRRRRSAGAAAVLGL